MPIYPATGPSTAILLNPNQSKFLFTVADRLATGNPLGTPLSSIAYQLERQKAASYPWGFAIEVKFNGAPGGNLELDVQGAEVDIDSHYVLLGTAITAVNSNNAARFDSTTVWPKYVRLQVVKLANDVQMDAIITR